MKFFKKFFAKINISLKLASATVYMCILLLPDDKKGLSGFIISIIFKT